MSDSMYFWSKECISHKYRSDNSSVCLVECTGIFYQSGMFHQKVKIKNFKNIFSRRTVRYLSKPSEWMKTQVVAQVFYRCCYSNKYSMKWSSLKKWKIINCFISTVNKSLKIKQVKIRFQSYDLHLSMGRKKIFLLHPEKSLNSYAVNKGSILEVFECDVTRRRHAL